MADTTAFLTREFMMEAFTYLNGRLIWNERPLHHFRNAWSQRVFNKRQAGTEAGTIISGYKMVNFARKRISSHRIVFLMHHGYLPPEVDHINGNPLDNRVENLRAATHQQNLRNIRTSRANRSGVKGVSLHKLTGKWQVGIRDGGRWVHLGLFSNIEDASACRRAAEVRVYGEFAHGR